MVSGNYFQVLGLRPFAGRLFNAADETAKDANPVVVLSYDYWRTRFAASREVIGQTLRINGHPFTIVGVAPENFHTAIGGYRPSIFVPVTMSEIAMPWSVSRHNLDNHQSLWLTVVARLKPGVTIPQAQASLAPLWHSLRAQELTLYKQASPRFKAGFLDKTTMKVIDDSRGFSPGRVDLKTPLVILLSMAGLLMAMCALNVATLLLLRSAARVREMSMRYALGAKSSRIVRQLVIEGGMLGAAGVAGGLALSPVLAIALVRLMTSAQPGHEPYSASVDGRVLAVCAGAFHGRDAAVLHRSGAALPAAGSWLVRCGRVPERRRRAPNISARRRWASRSLSAFCSWAEQGCLCGRSQHLRDQPVGWDTRNVANFSLDPTISGYGEDRTPQIIKAALDALGGFRACRMAAGTDDSELMGNSETNGYTVQGHKQVEGEDMGFESPRITPGFFATMRQPCWRGGSSMTATARTPRK